MANNTNQYGVPQLPSYAQMASSGLKDAISLYIARKSAEKKGEQADRTFAFKERELNNNILNNKINAMNSWVKNRVGLRQLAQQNDIALHDDEKSARTVAWTEANKGAYRETFVPINGKNVKFPNLNQKQQNAFIEDIVYDETKRARDLRDINQKGNADVVKMLNGIWNLIEPDKEIGW